MERVDDEFPKEEAAVFELKNGPINQITPVLLIKMSTLPVPFHWVPVGLLSYEFSMRAVEGYIKSHLIHLTENVPAYLTAAQVRKAAIVLGTIRAVATTYYKLTDGDFIPGEYVQPILNGYLWRDGSPRYSVVASRREAAAGMERIKYSMPLVLTDAERSVIRALVKCGMGAPAMQGCSLILTNHQYQSGADSKSRKIFAAPERAYWKGHDIAEWFTEDLSLIQDLAWHKACHPIQIRIKTMSAMRRDIAERLIADGAAACASRLTAVETELSTASIYIKLFSTISPMFHLMGGRVGGLDKLHALIRIAESLPYGVQNPPLPESMPDIKGGYTITNRQTALAALSAMLNRNVEAASLCYGFYTALMDATMMTGGGANIGCERETLSLRISFSLNKLKSQSHASFIAGKELYAAYAAVRNTRIQEGDIVGPSISMNLE